MERTVTTSSLTHVCRLADGGMGRVDLAMRRVGGFSRMYAVKRLHPHLASDPDFRAMFLDEARIAGHLRHPSVVGVLDVGEDEQGPYLVMDYVDGLPLSNLLRLARNTGEPMAIQLAVRIARSVAEGLHAAHEVEVDGRKLELVHRDLTPQNIMVGWDGSVRITDFGIAKALGRTTRTTTGVIKGKLAYMAPEQITTKVIDRRADLYSLGIVLFEMLSGERFYERPGNEVVALDVLETPARDIGELRADVPDELVQLLFELLAKTPAARPATAHDVAVRLEAALASILCDEEAAGTADYLEVVAGDMRREQAKFVHRAVTDVEPPSKHAPTSRVHWVIGIGALVVAGASTAIAAMALSRSDPPTIEPKPGPTVSAPASTTQAFDETFEAAPAPVAQDEVGTEAVEQRPEEPSPPARTRRRRTRRVTMTEATKHRLPEWVGFER